MSTALFLLLISLAFSALPLVLHACARWSRRRTSRRSGGTDV